MNPLTMGLSYVGCWGLPVWGSRDYPNQWLNRIIYNSASNLYLAPDSKLLNPLWFLYFIFLYFSESFVRWLTSFYHTHYCYYHNCSGVSSKNLISVVTGYSNLNRWAYVPDSTLRLANFLYLNFNEFLFIEIPNNSLSTV